MTLKEKVKEVEPEMVGENHAGGVSGCPDSYSYLNIPLINPEGWCDIDRCEDCWNREWKEETYAERN